MAEEKDKLRHEKDFIKLAGIIMYNNSITKCSESEYHTGYDHLPIKLPDLLHEYRQYLEKQGIIKDYQSEKF